MKSFKTQMTLAVFGSVLLDTTCAMDAKNLIKRLERSGGCGDLLDTNVCEEYENNDIAMKDSSSEEPIVSKLEHGLFQYMSDNDDTFKEKYMKEGHESYTKTCDNVYETYGKMISSDQRTCKEFHWNFQKQFGRVLKFKTAVSLAAEDLTENMIINWLKAMSAVKRSRVLTSFYTQDYTTFAKVMYSYMLGNKAIIRSKNIRAIEEFVQKGFNRQQIENVKDTFFGFSGVEVSSRWIWKLMNLTTHEAIPSKQIQYLEENCLEIITFLLSSGKDVTEETFQEKYEEYVETVEYESN